MSQRTFSRFLRLFVLVLSVSMMLVSPLALSLANAQGRGATLTASPASPVACNTPITFTFTILGLDRPKPKSTTDNILVTFSEGAQVLGTVPAAIDPNNPNLDVAKLTVTLPPGTHTITASDAFQDSVSITIQVLACPSEVPEGDTLLLMGGGLGGVVTWLGWQRRKLMRKNK